MNPGPYLNGYLPVSRASDALRNQADTMLSELHGSIDRAKAFREKLAAREAEKADDEPIVFPSAGRQRPMLSPLFLATRPVRRF